MQTAPVTVDAPVAVKPATKSRYIAGPLYDGIFFIFSPLLALALGIAIHGSPLETNEVSLWGHKGSVANYFIASFIFAHLFIVFFRSHGNRAIFKLHPWRFTLVPLVLLAAIGTSTVTGAVCIKGPKAVQRIGQIRPRKRGKFPLIHTLFRPRVETKNRNELTLHCAACPQNLSAAPSQCLNPQRSFR